MRRTALYTAAALLLAASCNKALMEPQKMGSISLSLSSDVEVVARTKADAVDCSDFLVDIYGTTLLGQDYASEQCAYKALPDPFPLPFGRYYVSAQSCLESQAVEGFGCVRYHGVSQQVGILSYDQASVAVECKMANGKATLVFDDSFLDDFSDVRAELTVGDRKVSLSSAQANALTEVYFNVPSEGAGLVYRVYGTIAAGTEQERELSYTNESSPLKLSPAKWAKITIKSNHNGIIGPGVTVDGEMGNDSSTEVIDPEQGSDVVDGTVPTISILVDERVDDATVVDCIIDILK